MPHEHDLTKKKIFPNIRFWTLIFCCNFSAQLSHIQCMIQSYQYNFTLYVSEGCGGFEEGMQFEYSSSTSFNYSSAILYYNPK